LVFECVREPRRDRDYRGGVQLESSDLRVRQAIDRPLVGKRAVRDQGHIDAAELVPCSGNDSVRREVGKISLVAENISSARTKIVRDGAQFRGIARRQEQLRSGARETARGRFGDG
jgi:hypothetical protein